MAGRRVASAALVFVACAWCGWVSAYQKSTWPARATWLLSLAAVMVVGIVLVRGRRGARFGWHMRPVAESWPRPGHGGPRPILGGLSPWIAIAVVAVAWDVLALDTAENEHHLTISALSQAYRPLHAAILLVWMGVGVVYASARSRSPVGREREEGPGAATAAMLCAVAARWHLPSLYGPALLVGTNNAVGVGFWLAVPACAVLVEVFARRSEGRVATFEELLRLLSGPAAGRAVAIAAWVFAGWHLFSH
jgi:hypothetical protein